MADPNMTKNNENQTIRHEQAKSEVSGGGDRQREQGMDKDAKDKSAIGGQSRNEPTSEDKNRELDKSRSETTGQR